jgi:hypothetical protein
MKRKHREWTSIVSAGSSTRLLALSLAVVAVTLVVCTGPAYAVTTWFDDFSDGSATDGSPLTWSPHPGLEGDYNATSGDYVLTPGLGPDDNQSMVATVETTTFTDLSIRTRMVTSPGEGSGTLGVVGRLDFATLSGYVVLLSDNAHLEVLSVIGGVPADEDIDNINPLLDEAGNELKTNVDTIFQLDVIGDTLSVTAWRPGEPQPAPQSVTTNSDFATGSAGIIFNENADFSSGTYRWVTAASARIINGDVNFDGEVNGLDVDPFVEAVLGGGYAAPADMNGDGAVDGLDVDPFVAAVVGGGAAASPLDVADVPEPSTILLALLALVGSACCAARRRGRP